MAQMAGNKIKLSGFQLKCIAIITMVIDHVGDVFFSGNLVWRYIGRLSFPIFCFLLVEGFFHTRNVKKYLIRLGIFALISEIPYDLAFYGKFINLEKQNVFCSLFLGVLMMFFMEKSNEIWEKAAFALLSMWAAEWFCFDYAFRGILLILIFYIFHDNKKVAFPLAALWNFIRLPKIQGYGALAVLPIALYSGERGYKAKYFFYVFYPAHLLVIFLIKQFI